MLPPPLLPQELRRHDPQSAKIQPLVSTEAQHVFNLDADLAGTKFLRKHPCRGDHGRLARRVERGAGTVGFDGGGGDIDDTSAIVAKGFDSLLRRKESSEDVGIELPVKLFLRDAF
jgi:hypothetical protein